MALTRRDRHLRIIESFGHPTDSRMRHHIGMVQARMGYFATFNDAAIEAIARELLEARAFQQELNRKNRARREAAL